jgi:hypothetical protein
MSRRPCARRAAVLLVCASVGLTLARGEQARVAASDPSDVQRGEARGVAISSRGRLFLAPRITALGKQADGSVPSAVFAATADGEGAVFLATGPDGEVVKVARAGERTVFFRATEPLVTAVTLLPGGDLLAASAPGGRIYRIHADGKGSVWCETQERYVWALAANADGSVFAATGDRGRLLKIDRNGKPSVFFDADETHLVSLALAQDGGVWAGGSARGLVYRIDAAGHGLVVYDDELPEARAIAVTPRGDLIVAFDAPPVTEKRLPALRLRMASGAAGPGEAMTDLDARQAPAMQGVIEGLPTTEVEDTVPLRGKIVRVTPDGAAVELWRSRGEAPFAIVLDDQDRPVFATGEPAKIWRVEGPGETALLATLDEGQATAFARNARTFVAATSNPAATYRIESALSSTGTFLAPPSDAGSVARWGKLSWRGGSPGGRVELFTRTGNCEEPDGTWSAWSPAQTDPAGSVVGNPEGRFLQWRATMAGSTDDGPSLNGVAASYATRNRAPSIRDFRIDPACGAISAKATLRWSAADPDGDNVTVDVQVKPAGTTDWKSAVRTDPVPSKPTDPSLGNDGSSKDGKATWDTANWDEGVYDVRAIASDGASNPPSEALVADTELPGPVRVDRTPPTIEAKRKGGTIDVTVTDAMSQVARLEVIVDGRVAFSPRALDGVCDGPRESFKFDAAQVASAGTWSLRATDAAGNAVETPVPAP